MAHGVPGFVRIGAVLAGCALVAACTPDAGPTQTPTPSAPVSPPRVSPTPSAIPNETDLERRERLDFEAAVKAYRDNVDEQDRQAQLGIAQETTILKQTSQGRYLKFTLASLATIRKRGWRAQGVSDVAGLSRGGWKKGELEIVACEDGSKIRFVDKRGKDVTPGNLRRIFVQTYTVVAVEGRWKLSDLSSLRVKSFEGAACDRS